MRWLALLVSLHVYAVNGATLFSQPVGNNGLISSAPTNLMGGPGSRAFDNFSLLAGATVNEVVWWGMFSKSLPNFEISIFQGGIYGPPVWTSSHAFVQKQTFTSRIGISMER